MADPRLIPDTATRALGQGEYLAQHAGQVREAAQRIAPHVKRTPAIASDLAPGMVLKCECFQPTGSFKVRGAFNAVLALRERHPAVAGVIAVSSGNHAQAVALAARTAGLTAVILIPHDANPQKIAATRALGAEVITEGITFENREQCVRQVAQARGLALIHPFDDWDVIHGQGTAALELLEQSPKLGLVAMPIGGGGLASGSALALKAQRPDIKIVAVEPEHADDAFRSWQTGVLQTLPSAPQTIADGVRAVAIGERNFEVLVERRLIDAIVTVSEAELERSLLRAWTGAKLALEPTAALPLAAALSGKLDAWRGTESTLGLMLTGGNFDPALVARLLSR